MPGDDRMEESYRRLFERHPQPMWVFDPRSLRFLAVNEAALATYGYSREEFLAMTIADIRPPEDREALRGALADADRRYASAGVWRHRKKDGTIMNVRVASNALEFEGRTARLVLAEDITDRMRLEEQLRQAQKMEAIGNLAGGIAHDFNNILLVIRGHTATLLRELRGSPIRANVEQIDLAAGRAGEFTHQLLAFSQTRVTEPEVVDLNALIEEMVHMLGQLLGDIRVDLRLAADLAPIVVDRALLGQAVLNLVLNARDAMPTGGTLRIRTADVQLDDAYAALHADVVPGAYVLLQVTDSGVGMDEATRARAFEPYFTTKEIGTGIGLTTVFGAVKRSNGSISLYSEPRLGTTFKLYFPRAGQQAGEPASQPAGSPEGSETILLVEDTEVVRTLLIEALESYGYTVLAAADAEQALELFAREQGSVDLLMTDVVLPGISGLVLAERILAAAPEMRVLFTSGFPSETIFDDGASGRHDFIEKPYLPDELARKLRALLT
jgi:two-component system cell cycle sensor histidine kinase/response regulator CckA